MAAAAILDLSKMKYIRSKKSILVGTRCMLLKFGEHRFIHAEIINIFLNSRWRPPAILDFEKFAYLTHGINTSWYQVYAVQIW